MNNADISNRKHNAVEHYANLYSQGVENLPDEEWRPIPGYECKYVVSSIGRVMRLSRKVHPAEGIIMLTNKHRLVKPSPDSNGYMGLDLYDDNSKAKHYMVHRLVAVAFIPNPENKPTVNHIDGVTWHNEISNLEWATYAEQQAHGWKLGLYTRKRTNSLDEIERAWKKSVEVRSKFVYCVEDNTTYSSVAAAERAANNGVCNGNLCTALKHKSGVYKGKHYMYKNEA